MRPGRFRRTHRLQSSVPTASMADIAFLLLIFFMATTIFRMEDGLPVTLPRAESTQPQDRESVLHIWVDRTGRISINDRVTPVNEVAGVVADVLAEEPALVVAFNADERVRYRAIADVIQELRRANAVRISFTSEKERGDAHEPAETD